MFKIRRSIFETNSSSTHSVSINRKGLKQNEMEISLDNMIHVSLGKFDWEWKAYTEQIDKLSYLVTLIMHINGMDIGFCDNDKERRDMLDKLMKKKDFKHLSNVVAKYAGCDGVYIDTSEGYIDHQSYEDYSSLRSFMDNNGIKSIKEFIFEPEIILVTGNDNEKMPNKLLNIEGNKQ